MDKAVIVGVPSDQVAEYWPQLKPLIEKPLKKTDAHKYYTTNDIRRFLESRDMQCWVAVRDKIIACAITQIITFPRRTVLDILFIGGSEIDTWIHSFELMKEYARENGCQGIRGPGRRGWLKKLPEIKEHSIIWDLDL